MNAPSPSRRDAWAGRLSLLAGAAALPWPKLAVAAFLASAVAALALDGRPRRLALGGLALSTLGLGWFIARDAAPAIVMAGRRSGEERAVSRLRELQWAEQQAFELGLRTNAAGAHRYLSLPELLEGGASALLRSDVFRPVPGEPGVLLSDGYRFVIDLSADGRGYQAYAWPGATGGTRLFFGDEADRVCEAPVGDPASLASRPPPFAAFAAARADAVRCDRGLDGRQWAPWKGKRARGAR